MAAGFAVTAGGMLMLSTVGAHGSYLSDVLPGMLVAGIGLGIVLVCVSVSVMTGAKDEETGMLSGPEHDRPRDRRLDRHRRPGHDRRELSRRGRAAALSQGISDAFLAVAGIAALASVIALVVLPSAATFLPKLRLAPRVAIH